MAKTHPSKHRSQHKKLDTKFYEEELERLQTELVYLQEWVKHKGLKIVVLFEGRDAAGKGGVIKRIRERVSPRVFRVEALPAPNDRERTQIYYQRYVERLPAGGEIVLFDRSRYNRGGVEKVMKFCSKKEHADFLASCPRFEKSLTDAGIILIKYWLTVSNENQEKRFLKRIHDPKRRWKLSPMDLEARRLWYDYSHARDEMLAATDTEWAPWHIIDSNDKKRARLNCIAHLLSQIPYKRLKNDKITLPKRSRKGAYDADKPLLNRNWIADLYG